MRKQFLAVAGWLAGFTSLAQDPPGFKPFKTDVSAGYAMVTGDGLQSAGLLAVEPKYALTRKLALGLRLETVVIPPFFGYDDNAGGLNIRVDGSYSLLATIDYYFRDNYNFRPFAGMGGGVFSITNVSTFSTVTQSKPGIMARAGLEAERFRMGLEYNILGRKKINNNPGNSSASFTPKNNYASIKFGICIGGRPR